MSSTTVYLCEAAGPRIFRLAPQNLGSFPFLPSFTTWDLTPAGEDGVCVFRAVVWSFFCSNGYSIGITPIVDDVALGEQTFNAAGSGSQRAEAVFAQRGSRISATVRVITLSGDLEHRDLMCFYAPLRVFPS